MDLLLDLDLDLLELAILPVKEVILLRLRVFVLLLLQREMIVSKGHLALLGDGVLIRKGRGLLEEMGLVVLLLLLRGGGVRILEGLEGRLLCLFMDLDLREVVVGGVVLERLGRWKGTFRIFLKT